VVTEPRNVLAYGPRQEIIDDILELLARETSNLSWCLVGSTAFRFHLNRLMACTSDSHKREVAKNYLKNWKVRGVDVCLMPEVSPNVLGKWLILGGFMPYVLNLETKYLAFVLGMTGLNLSIFPCGQLQPGDTEIHLVKGENVRVVKFGVAFADLMSVIVGVRDGDPLDPKHLRSFGVMWEFIDKDDLSDAEEYWNRTFSGRFDLIFGKAVQFCMGMESNPSRYKSVMPDPYRRVGRFRIGVLALYAKAAMMMPWTIGYLLRKPHPWSW